MKKRFTYLMMLLCSIFFVKTVNAASIGISSSSKSVTVGSTVTVTVNPNGLIGKFSVTSSNPSVLSGGTLGDWIEGGSKSYQFKAKSKGTATITVVAVDTADSSGNQVTGSNSVTISVGDPVVVQKSKNNYLSSLSVEGATLDPEFKKDVLSYNVELEAGTSKTKIDASLEDKKASVSGIGEVDLEEGDNNFEIKVTAEDGSQRVYNLKIVVKEYDPIEVKVGNKKYTIVRNSKNITPPPDYKETTIKIKGEKVLAFKNKITKYTLVMLKDSKGKQDFYIYKNGKFTKYKEYTFSEIVIYPLEFSKVPKGYSKTKIKLKDEEVAAYKLSSDSNYFLIYGMNVTTGKKHIYMYEKEEGTIQIYNNKMKDLVTQNDQYKLMIVSLGGVSTFLLIICIILLVNNHKYKSKHKKTKKKTKEVDINSKQKED